jgi:molybdate transport system substrate-binding protein
MVRFLHCVLQSLLLVGTMMTLEAAARQPPRIAAAANLSFAMAEVAAEFERTDGARVEVVFGASGTLTRQILDGAPFEMFLAADEEFPARIAAAGLSRDSGVVYAIGRLVLFAPRNSPLAVDPELKGLARLLDSGGLTRFAIANPDVAPYGRAAEALLRKHGLLDRLRPALVLGDSVTQAAQFATTGNAVGGLIAYSILRAPRFSERGTYALIADGDHPPLRQRMVLLKRAGPVAERFHTFIQGPAARAILQRHGFALPH